MKQRYSRLDQAWAAVRDLGPVVGNCSVNASSTYRIRCECSALPLLFVGAAKFTI